MQPKAIDFASERRRHRGFVGRGTVLTQLDQLLLEESADRWVVVTGGPGMGKSALLSTWLARRAAAGELVPHHFIRRKWSNWDDPASLVASLIAQIEARYPDLPEPETDADLSPAARLAATLGRVSEAVLEPRNARLVVLIDGLDEYDPPSGPPPLDPLGVFLPYTLPPGISVLCASRPRHPYVDALATRGVLLQLDLDDAQQFAADNEATVRAFWEKAGPELGVDAQFSEEAVRRADGNVQHAVMLHQHLAGMPPAQRRIESIPRGLAALLASAWERIATNAAIVDGLGVLCVAREALTIDEVGTVAGWTGEGARRAFLRGARELLVESQRTEDISVYRMHHESIRAHVAKAIGGDALRGHHRALAQKLATWPAPLDPVARLYALRHALLHRVEAGDWQDAWRVAGDLAFIEAKCRVLGAHEAEADITRAAGRCPADVPGGHHQRFADLARTLWREAHWLRAAPEATAALVWNRLRQAGWSAAYLDQHLRVAPEVSFLHLRHIAASESPAMRRKLAGHAGLVNACAATPDGRCVVSGSADGTLRVWDLEKGLEIATLRGHTLGVLACAVTPDGRRVVSGGADGTLRVWDLEKGAEINTLEGHADTVSACVVTPDGRHVVSGSHDRRLKIWELATGREIITLQGHADKVSACAVTLDGRRIVSASSDGTLKVWDLATGREVATLRGHNGFLLACAVTPDGRHVVSASAEGTLELWDLGARREIGTLRGHSARVLACAVTPDGRRVVSASADSTLRIWDLGTGHEVATLRGDGHYVSACAITPDGRLVVSGSWDSTLKVWDLRTKQELDTPHGHALAVMACALTPDGQRVVSASVDKTLKVWDVATGHEVATLQGHADKVNACAVTPDGQRVVSASRDNTLKVWNLATRREVATLQGHSSPVTSCAIVADGEQAVSSSHDKTLKVWDLGTGYEIATLHGHAGGVSACTAMPDGHHVVSASWDKTLKVWDLGTKHEVATLLGHEEEVSACVVTLDGRHMVSASGDKTLKVWDLDTRHEIATLRGHTRSISACAVTPDGRRVISGSWDNTLKVWDLDTGRCLLTHYVSAPYCALVATATTIVAGDAAGAIWFFEWPPSDRPSHAEDGCTSSPAGQCTDANNAATDHSVVDIGILTIRDDEFRAVLAVFPEKAGTHTGAHREYTLRYADAGKGKRYRIAIVRQVAQGTGEAQDAARDMIDDLRPRMVLVVGIAGGLPSDDVTLGDVVISTRIYDFTVEARKAGEAPSYEVTGGPVARTVEAVVANLAAREDDLGDWPADLPQAPRVAWASDGQIYGPPDWQRELRDKLAQHYSAGAKPRPPIYATGPIASSDRLVKDPDLLIQWLQTARSMLAIEMESAGVYRAARERCPMLAIRGISDIVGLRRGDAWTKYACASAAAFTRAFLRTRPAGDPL